MKEFLSMLSTVFADSSLSRCSTKNSVRDLKSIRHRVHNEGLSFLTITLPQFCEDFFTALENGKVTSDLFVGWRKRQCLPAFLLGFTSLVFDSHTGEKIDEPQTEAIRAVRQICYLFKKVKIACTEQRTIRALQKYVQVDSDVGSSTPGRSDEDFVAFQEVSNVVITDLCGEIDTERLIPHHGPGSTYERLTGNRKYFSRKANWYKCLEPFFDESIFYSSEEIYNSSKVIRKTFLESTVRVITVMKTLKSPRTIAMEPVAIQMAQQSLKDFLVEKIERGSLMSGHVNFTDQKINQRLALESSKTRAFATLDMSDASDRISSKSIWLMLASNPTLRDLIFCCRSTKAKVLGKFINLNKFASMGSALCFPMMAMYFYIVVIVGILKHRGLCPTPVNIRKAGESVYVYGDDIIVPTDVVETVYTTLADFGNVVSRKKSFYKSNFRESCGVDAHNGEDITPVYIRHMIPQSVNDASAIVSYVSAANLLFEKGYKRTACYIKNVCEAVVGKLPTVRRNSPGLGWHFDDGSQEPVYRWNRKLQVHEVRTLVPKVIYEKDHLRDYNALTKCLLVLTRRKSNLDLSTSDEKHLVRSPVRGALTLKRRWVSVH